MTTKYSYRDLGHPNYNDALAGHNSNTLKLVHTVAEFAHKISLAHENFANEVLNIVESFKKRNIEIRSERGPVGTSEEKGNGQNNHRRPVDCPSSLSNAWEILLQETQYDAQAHADAATLLMKNVYTPLTEITAYKKSQSKKLHSFRDNFDKLLNQGEEGVLKCHAAYIETYQAYRTNSNSRDALHYMAEYHNSHNDYLLQIRGANQQQIEYHQEALPYLLEELEDIYIDIANTLNGAIESHALLLLTKANEQSRRFDSILKICKQVNPKSDVGHFVLSVTQDPAEFLPQHFIFNPPSDPNIPGSELGTLKDQIVNDRFTEAMLREKRAELQKEASELTSYLKQNQDITQTLTNVCQRNLANHLYAKVYETQEDLCRKRNEIRIANLQLAAIRAQIELLSPKHNGNSVDSLKPHNKSSIKGMWKKAFRSIRSNKPKDEKDKAEGDRDSKHSRTPLNRSGSKDFEKQPKDESKTASQSSRQSSLKRVLRRKDSKEEKQEEEYSRDEVDEIDPVYSLLKCAADLPRQGKHSGTGQGHACCYRATGTSSDCTLNMAAAAAAARSNSRSSSPSSASGKPTAKERRVRFMQETKSQSLDTPYHHSHEQQRLNTDLDSDHIHERASSFTAINQCHHGDRTKHAFTRQRSRQGRLGVLQHQRSVSVDDPSPSGSEHEKWEREAMHENIWKGQHRLSVDLGSGRNISPRGSRELPHTTSPQPVMSARPRVTPVCQVQAPSMDVDTILEVSAAEERRGEHARRPQDSLFDHRDYRPRLCRSQGASPQSYSPLQAPSPKGPSPKGPSPQGHSPGPSPQGHSPAQTPSPRGPHPRSSSSSPHRVSSSYFRGPLFGESHRTHWTSTDHHPSRYMPEMNYVSSPHSPPHRRRKKLNMRMKSFSLDTPEPPKQHAIEQSTKKKSSSFTNSKCIGGSPRQVTSPPSSSSSSLSASQRRSRFWNKSTSLDIDDGVHPAPPGGNNSPRSNHSMSPRTGSPKSQRRTLPVYLYVVLFTFKGREKDELDLRAGWRVNAVDTTDPDWWKGRCNGKVGFFPARYVERITPGEKVLQVVQGVEISQDNHVVKLLKDQIVIQEREPEGDMVLIRTADKDRFPCPTKYLQEI